MNCELCKYSDKVKDGKCYCIKKKLEVVMANEQDCEIYNKLYSDMKIQGSEWHWDVPQSTCVQCGKKFYNRGGYNIDNIKLCSWSCKRKYMRTKGLFDTGKKIDEDIEKYDEFIKEKEKEDKENAEREQNTRTIERRKRITNNTNEI